MRYILVTLIALLLATSISGIVLARVEAVQDPGVPTEFPPVPMTDDPFVPEEIIQAPVKIEETIGNNGETEPDLKEDTIIARSEFSSLDKFKLDGQDYYIQHKTNLLGGHIIRVTTTPDKKDTNINKKTIVLTTTDENEGNFNLQGYTVNYKIKEINHKSATIYLESE